MCFVKCCEILELKYFEISEQAVLRVLADLLPDVPVSLSSDVLPELMEYERAVTTVCNSYVKPKVSLYLTSLLKSLEGETDQVFIIAGCITRLHKAKPSIFVFCARMAAYRPFRWLHGFP